MNDQVYYTAWDVDARRYHLHGPNAVLFDWIRGSERVTLAFGERSISLNEIATALSGSAGEAERLIASKHIIKALWGYYPELGPYPFLDVLSKFEFNRLYYEDYRDHSGHQLKVFLLGWYLFERNQVLRSCILEEIEDSDEAGLGEFLRRWTIASVFHDIGYVLEHGEAAASDAKGWVPTQAALNECLEAPLSLVPAFKKWLTTALEKEVTTRFRIDVMKVRSPHDIDGTETGDLLDRIVKYGQRLHLPAVGHSGNPFRKYYNLALRTNPRGRSPFRDHGIVSTLLLLRTWDEYRRRLGAMKSHLPESDLRAEIERIEALTPHAEKSLLPAAGAMALHNIQPKLWTPDDVAAAQLSLEKFSIELAGPSSFPLGFLLGLVDTLQDWDRPRFRELRPDESARTDQDMEVHASRDKVFIYVPSTTKDPEKGRIQYFKAKTALQEYLDKDTIEVLVEFQKYAPDTMRVMGQRAD